MNEGANDDVYHNIDSFSNRNDTVKRREEIKKTKNNKYRGGTEDATINTFTHLIVTHRIIVYDVIR